MWSGVVVIGLLGVLAFLYFDAKARTIRERREPMSSGGDGDTRRVGGPDRALVRWSHSCSCSRGRDQPSSPRS